MSPYQFAANNPFNNIDVNGESITYHSFLGITSNKTISEINCTFYLFIKRKVLTL